MDLVTLFSNVLLLACLCVRSFVPVPCVDTTIRRWECLIVEKVAKHWELKETWGDLMGRWLYGLWAKMLTLFGNIKVFKFPFFMVYDPDDYQITGEESLKIMAIIRPGDVLLRGYNHYADGFFIPDDTKFSHGAIYIGNNTVIHAVAEGVCEIDILEFLRCDRIAVLRPRFGIKEALAKAKEFLNNRTPYDFGFKRGVSALYCFELCGECYSKLSIPKKQISKAFGIIKKADVYLASSFFQSCDFSVVVNINPRFGTRFLKVDCLA